MNKLSKIIITILAPLAFNLANAQTEVIPENHDTQINPPIKLQGHPLTSVVVTQCALIVAVYLTMPDGKLIRYDAKTATGIKAEDLLTLAYTADRSERVEVDCNSDKGAVGFEKHDPV